MLEPGFREIGIDGKPAFFSRKSRRLGQCGSSFNSGFHHLSGDAARLKREVSRAYGVLLEDRFFSRRAYFLIDREGILRWSHVETELGHKRDDAELLRQIAAL